MTESNPSFKITTPLTLGNYIKGACIRMGFPSIVASLLVVALLILLNFSSLVVILVIVGYILLIPAISLYKLYKSRRNKIKTIEFVFTPTEFIMEAPGNSKIQIDKSVIKRVRCYKTFAMLQTSSGKQPILMTPTQSIELKKFLHNNDYNV